MTDMPALRSLLIDKADTVKIADFGVGKISSRPLAGRDGSYGSPRLLDKLAPAWTGVGWQM